MGSRRYSVEFIRVDRDALANGASWLIIIDPADRLAYGDRKVLGIQGRKGKRERTRSKRASFWAHLIHAHDIVLLPCIEQTSVIWSLELQVVWMLSIGIEPWCLLVGQEANFK